MRLVERNKPDTCGEGSATYMSKNELRSSGKLRKERFCDYVSMREKPPVTVFTQWRAVNWQIDAVRRNARLVERNKF